MHAFPFSPCFFSFILPHFSLGISSLSPILYDLHIQQLLFFSAANSADNLFQFDIHPSISSKGILLFTHLCPHILYHCTMCSPSFCISSIFKGRCYTVYLVYRAHSNNIFNIPTRSFLSYHSDVPNTMIRRGRFDSESESFRRPSRYFNDVIRVPHWRVVYH